MIISINGYSGSGKDLTGKIIQHLTSHHGIKGTRTFTEAHGKTDDQGYGYGSFTGYNSPWQVKRWGDKLKEVASLLTGFPIEKFEDQDFKKTVLPKEWSKWATLITDVETGENFLGEIFYNEQEAKKSVEDYLKASTTKGNPGSYTIEAVKQDMTVRELLQFVGTEGLRKGLHQDTWINALMSDYDENSDWVITDTRMLNEANEVKKRGGINIRINRPGVGPVNNHSSEIELDKYDFDYVIDNNGSTEDLVEKLREILIKINVLQDEQAA